jgi:hypothetical protein
LARANVPLVRLLALADSFRDGCSWLIYSERKVAFGRLVLAGLVVQLISRLMWLFFLAG